LQRIEFISDLGVISDEKLKFDKHVYEKIKKTYSILGLIKHNFRHILQISFVLLYKSLVRPHLEYANAVWSPYRQKYTEALEKVQMRATKITINNKELSYPERLKILDIPTLVYRRHQGDMIEVYKIINGYYNDGCTVKLTLSQNTITRGHRFKLAHLHTHLDKRITCQRGSARQCCKGHVSFLWEKPIFDPSQKPNPLTYNHQNWHD
jgi:ribonuclease P/MRP protein subunit RPP40